MPNGEVKPCAQCGERMIRKNCSEQMWESRKAHRECRGEYDRAQNKLLREAAGIKRYFRRNHKIVKPLMKKFLMRGGE